MQLSRFMDLTQICDKAIFEITQLYKTANSAQKKIDQAKSFRDEGLLQNGFYELYYKYLIASGHIENYFDRLAMELPPEGALDYYHAMALMRGVEARAVNGNLWLSFPHPAKRYREHSNKNKFVVSHKMNEVVDQITPYKKKTIHLIHVYPKEQYNLKNVVDFDNYDMKRIIDALCVIYPGEDNPISTKVTNKTIQSDIIAPLSYAIIDNNFSMDYSDTDIFEVFGNNRLSENESSENAKNATMALFGK